MEFDKIINDRRSIRKFKNDLISVDDINYIIKSASLSPSAYNKQPWNYIIFTKNKKNDLLLLISDYITNKDCLTYDEKIMKNCLSFMNEAPVLILVYSNLENNTINDYLSIGSSMEHICLSAQNINIGSLWLGVITVFEDLINTKYNLSDLSLISAVVLGYQNELPNARPRKELKEIVKFL